MEESKQEGIFLGSLPRAGNPIKLNKNSDITCVIPKLVTVSATEVELGVLFPNMQEARIMQLIFCKMGHLYLQILVHGDNTKSVQIVNNTIKRQQSCATEIQCF